MLGLRGCQVWERRRQPSRLQDPIIASPHLKGPSEALVPDQSVDFIVGTESQEMDCVFFRSEVLYKFEKNSIVVVNRTCPYAGQASLQLVTMQRRVEWVFGERSQSSKSSNSFSKSSAVPLRTDPVW